jgi:YegS/Rv2252/BmrU family lipid kinase
VSTIAVVAHERKTLGAGLGELRRILAERGFESPLWYEVSKSKEASAASRRAAQDGADLLFVWGGDGTVQRCVDALAGKPVDLAILPAGTANLLASNLKIPTELGEAVDVGLFGARRRLDVGVLNGKRFAVMAGVGLDAAMMRAANGRLKDRLGKLAYVWTGARASRMSVPTARITVDGAPWFRGEASCILLGQMGSLGGGLSPFPDARPDDGILEVGVTTARGALQWSRVLARIAAGHPERSPFARMTRGHHVRIKLDRPTPYQLDGGARKPRRTLVATIEPSAISVCVPH